MLLAGQPIARSRGSRKADGDRFQTKLDADRHARQHAARGKRRAAQSHRRSPTSKSTRTCASTRRTRSRSGSSSRRCSALGDGTRRRAGDRRSRRRAQAEAARLARSDGLPHRPAAAHRARHADDAERRRTVPARVARRSPASRSRRRFVQELLSFYSRTPENPDGHQHGRPVRAAGADPRDPRRRRHRHHRPVSAARSTAVHVTDRDSLQTPLQFLKGVGPRRAADLQRVGLATVEDLLYRFPDPLRGSRHASRPSRRCKPGVAGSVVGEVVGCGIRPTRRPRFKIFEMLVRDRHRLAARDLVQPAVPQRRLPSASARHPLRQARAHVARPADAEPAVRDPAAGSATPDDGRGRAEGATTRRCTRDASSRSTRRPGTLTAKMQRTLVHQALRAAAGGAARSAARRTSGARQQLIDRRDGAARRALSAARHADRRS